MTKNDNQLKKLLLRLLEAPPPTSVTKQQVKSFLVIPNEGIVIHRPNRSHFHRFICIALIINGASLSFTNTSRYGFGRAPDESAKTEVNIAEDLDCLATFQLLGEKNNELLQLNEDILNLLLMSENINEDDIEKESRSADEYSLNFKRMSLLVDRKTNPSVNADTLSSVGEYEIFVSDFNKNYHCTFNAFDQEKICAEICQIPTGFWSKELEDNGIHLTDQECLPSCSSSTIHLLIGADIAGKLMTGKILNLTCGLTATETLLGWTLMGRAPSSSDSISMTVTNLLIKDCNISDLCKLEAIGITDPTESKKKTEMHQGTSDYFRNTLTIDEEGRYEVALPWVLESSRLPDNRQMAEKQLSSVYKILVESERVGRLYALEVQTPAVENLLEKRASEIEDEKEETVQEQYVEHPEKLPESDKTSLPNLNTMKTRFGRKIQVPKRLDL
ncbi:hypothetical protein HNY73_019382 [Argiope bruennichi]|uniref:Peptidase aspartic putative domain-containing protein n=1 Tax=Argiope bruennichi TaxID=94029 RepID=A0A8T0EJI4_ARGBR|nr:hypothetical protein HNY73_019382 [Argiope bruennichi]